MSSANYIGLHIVCKASNTPTPRHDQVNNNIIEDLFIRQRDSSLWSLRVKKKLTELTEIREERKDRGRESQKPGRSSNRNAFQKAQF